MSRAEVLTCSSLIIIVWYKYSVTLCSFVIFSLGVWCFCMFCSWGFWLVIFSYTQTSNSFVVSDVLVYWWQNILPSSRHICLFSLGKAFRTHLAYLGIIGTYLALYLPSMFESSLESLLDSFSIYCSLISGAYFGDIVHCTCLFIYLLGTVVMKPPLLRNFLSHLGVGKPIFLSCCSFSIVGKKSLLVQSHPWF